MKKMKKIRAAVVGYGNIGKYALEALAKAPDFECAGVVRRCGNADGIPELAGYKVAKEIEDLGDVDVALLCVPSRAAQEQAEKYLAKGIATVDSFDIHTDIVRVREELGPVAEAAGKACVISAGWDPGTDSIVRALLLGLAPEGETYTTFGPGRSMGHTVAAKAIPGVADALSMTLPAGKGVHDRLVYVVLEEGADFAEVSKKLKADPYFAHDNTEVRQVESIAPYQTHNHGVEIIREGVSGCTENQKMGFNMQINNPALTGQVLVNAARAAVRQAPGCYTMIEIAPIDFLPGDKTELVRKLV